MLLRLGVLKIALCLLGILCIILLTSLLYGCGPNNETFLAESSQHLSVKKLVSYNSSVPLIWIGGVPRSGTTLIRAMLDAHPDVRCGEETRVVPRMLGIHSKMLQDKNEMNRLLEAHIDQPLLFEALGSYILTVVAGHGELAPHLCNKDPFAIRSLPTILSMFPNSKFLLMIRDGRAVAHSIITRKISIKGFDTKTYSGSLQNWNQAITSMFSVCKQAGASKCLPVYYERLVLYPKAQMERILSFLNIPWDEIVIHHEQAIGKKGGISLSRKEPSTNQVIKSINKEALSTWYGVIPEDVLGNIGSYAPMLSRLGYHTKQFPPDYEKHLDPKAEVTMDL